MMCVVTVILPKEGRFVQWTIRKARRGLASAFSIRNTIGGRCRADRKDPQKNPCYKGGLMIYTIYDASGKLRFESTNWPMARSALDLVISEGLECPQLVIRREPGGEEEAQ